MMKRSLISVLIVLLPLLGLSQTSSYNIVASKRGTTQDGRVFYNDLVIDSVQGEMFRTNKVGMDIIREINSDRKKQRRISDSLRVEALLLEQKYSLCDSSKMSLKRQKDVLEFQLNIRQKMIDNYKKQDKLSTRQLNDLKRKTVFGKIGWSVGGVFIGTTIVLGTLLLIR